MNVHVINRKLKVLRNRIKLRVLLKSDSSFNVYFSVLKSKHTLLKKYQVSEKRAK